MHAPRQTDTLREELALATLERRLFEGRSPAPVLDRYVLLEKIGAGGLGVVLRAYDPDLQRAVAIKLLRLREDAPETEVSELLDEARMMAQLSHPNVVTIHDVGRYGRRDLGLVGSNNADLGIPIPGVFLVMEFIDGGSLRDAMADELEFGPAWALLLDAGRGLAAAHARGVVHRDFKPANVLVDGDGRGRVGDFGLACHREVRGPHARAGTLAYMAPEQRAGRAATPRSDQFAFALTCAVVLARLSPEDARAGLGRIGTLPRRIRAVLLRATDPDPERRYVDMSTLLRDLESAASPRRWWIGSGVGLLGLGAVWTSATEDPCEHAGRSIEAAWNEPAAGRLRAALSDVDASFAGSSAQSVERALDAYAQRWSHAAQEACLDTHVRHVQSETRLDRRVDCLGRLRLEFAEAVDLLAHADSDTLVRSVDIVHGLGWIDACATPQSLHAAARLPDDPQARDRRATVGRQLARAKLLELSGRYPEAMAAASGSVQSPSVRDPGLRARAKLRMGSIAARQGRLPEAKALLLEGIQLAEGARVDDVAADGWIRLLWVAGVEMSDPAGETWASFARAALARIGDDPRRQAELAHGLGGLAYRSQRFDDALAHYQSALQMERALLSEDDPKIARTLNHIANVLLELDDARGAQPYAQRSLAIRERVLGTSHPLVAASLNNLVRVHMVQGQWVRAQALLARSLDITATLDLPEGRVAHALAADLDRELLDER